MGCNYSTPENRRLYKEAAALISKVQVTRKEYETIMMQLESDETEEGIILRRYTEIAWNNGIDRQVTCDGSGKWCGKTDGKCDLIFPVVVLSGVEGKTVMIYPEHTGGTTQKNAENPRIYKRDYCKWCAETDNVPIQRVIRGYTNVINS